MPCALAAGLLAALAIPAAARAAATSQATGGAAAAIDPLVVAAMLDQRAAAAAPAAAEGVRVASGRPPRVWEDALPADLLRRADEEAAFLFAPGPHAGAGRAKSLWLPLPPPLADGAAPVQPDRPALSHLTHPC
jgi:hypothetical protein